MLRFFIPVWGLFLGCSIQAQTFTESPGAAISDSHPLVSSLVVSGLPDTILPEGFGLESVCLNINYGEVKHLIITLFAPDGVMVKLTHLNGRREADHLANSCFGEKGKYFPFELPPYYGGYMPVLPLGVINNGQNPNGIWRLVVEEVDGEALSGRLDNWSLIFGKHPARADTILRTSNLPILEINTAGNYITDSEKIDARLQVCDHGESGTNNARGPFNGYSGPIGIETHGSSSLAFWQQSFSFETRDAAGDDLTTPLLGLPAGSDWVLHGPFSDKSLFRNALTYQLAATASEAYVPRARLCEVILNGSYLGVYTLVEKIKRGPDRVDISRLKKTDLSGDELTGGYIIKVDRKDAPGWYSPIRPVGGGKVYFNYVYPKAEEIQPSQAAYIQAFVDSFEQALLQPDVGLPTGWRQFADEKSFIDYFLFQEACKNVDAYRLSGFLYKPRDSEGGKLHAGPLWDFNLAWHNANYANNESPTGWTFHGEPYGVPFWWERLLSDDLFAENLQCRWIELRQTALSQRHIFSVIDSFALVLAEAQQRHYNLYPFMGRGLWPNPEPVADSFEEELANMKTWISERLMWMDNNLPGLCAAHPQGWAAAPWLVYPNPFQSVLNIFFEQSPEPEASLVITDLTGREVAVETGVDFATEIHLASLQTGFYLLVYRSREGKLIRYAKIIKN